MIDEIRGYFNKKYMNGNNGSVETLGLLFMVVFL